MQHYRLKLGRPVPGGDELEWANWMQTSIVERTVDRTKVKVRHERVQVITHFTGIEPPYRTTLYGGAHDKQEWSYETLGEAKMGHWNVVAMVRESDEDT